MEPSVFAASNKPENFNRFEVPLKWGIIAGITACIITTVNNMFLLGNVNYFLFLGATVFLFLVNMAFMLIAGFQQRKALGGYIEFKEAFQAIFIVIVLTVVISTIYGVIYTKVIDPDLPMRVKEETLRAFEKMKMPQDTLDEKIQQIDDQMKNSLKPGVLLQSIAITIITSSIFGMIAALIVRKKKPVFQNN